MDFKIITNPANPLHGKTYEEVLAAIQQDGWVLQFVWDGFYSQPS